MSDEHASDMPHSEGPAGGWGSLRGIAQIFGKEWPTPGVVETLGRQNKPGGFMCSSCAWHKPADYLPLEFCENGAKKTIWETTSARCRPEFFAAHSVTELRELRDHDLELEGRLTHPMRYEAASDRYVETTWQQAFDAIGAGLRRVDREQVVFYASGHAGLEASYLWALLARAYGNNNLPQSSNMCHETTSVGLKQVIGSSVGTVDWRDLMACDALFFFGQNPGSNSPRFLHPLKWAKERGAHIVTFNSLREQGLVSFVDPQNPLEMLTGHETRISDLYLQPKAGGDVAAILGLCKVVVQADDDARAANRSRMLDKDFIEQHTSGFDDFIAKVRAVPWDEIVLASGIARSDLEAAGQIYVKSQRVIGVYGMGLTQHVHGSLNIAMLVNLLLLRGNIGREGAGICPVRGHSNVQGQRTVGIAEKAALAPMDKLRQLFDFEPPAKDGMNIVGATEALFEGRVKAFVCLGGNLVRAVPDRARMERAWSTQDLTVMISTRLNRSHLFPGKLAWILPCLARSDADEQASGPQAVSVEDSLSCIHGSIGKRTPASEHLLSEVAIVAGIAKSTLDPNPKLKWDAWTADYGLVRDLIEATYPDDFRDYNRRLFTPGGFYRGNKAHDRIWETDTSRAKFTTPGRLDALGFEDREGRFRLVTLRSNDQFNTTIYGYSDRFRGIEGKRDVVLMNPGDIAAIGLAPHARVNLVTDVDDGHDRRLRALELLAYDIPPGTVAAYYPECNALVPIGHHDRLSQTPASKAIPVRVEAERGMR